MAFGASVRYHGTRGNEHEVLLNVIDAPRVKASWDRDFGRYRWVRSEPDVLSDFQYWAPNTSKRSSVMVVDIDSVYEHDLIDSMPILPNWIGINNANQHSQVIYYLETPVLGVGTRSRMYYNHVAGALTHTLGGDPRFSRHLSRNPFDGSGAYEWHAQHQERFSLRQLQAATVSEYDGVTPRPGYGRARRPERSYDSDGLQRWNLLWDVGRFEGYRLRAAGQLVEYSAIRAVLDATNAEIASIDDRGGRDERTLHTLATSISTWCNTRMRAGTGENRPLYTHDQCVRGGQAVGAERGAANVESGVLLRMQQASLAVRSASSIVKAAEIRFLREAGKTQMEIVEILGVSRSTVKRAWNDS